MYTFTCGARMDRESCTTLASCGCASSLGAGTSRYLSGSLISDAGVECSSGAGRFVVAPLRLRLLLPPATSFFGLAGSAYRGRIHG